MDDDSLKNAIEMMIYKNQHGELNIVFTPQSKQNNEYIGFLTVNNIPLKKYLHILLKQYSTKKGNFIVYNLYVCVCVMIKYYIEESIAIFM